MASQQISSREALSYGWAKMKSHLGLFVPLCLLSWFLSALQARLNGWHGAAVVLRWLIAPLLMLVLVQVSIAWLRVALKVHDEDAAELSELARVDLVQYFSYLIGWLLYGLIVSGGLVLLIVPGVLWAVKYGLAPFLIVDKGLDPLSAMRRSAVLTGPVRGQLVALGLVLLGVNILGALALGVGLFATVPTTMMAATYVYRKLSG